MKMSGIKGIRTQIFIYLHVLLTLFVVFIFLKLLTSEVSRISLFFPGGLPGTYSFYLHFLIFLESGMLIIYLSFSRRPAFLSLINSLPVLWRCPSTSITASLNWRESFVYLFISQAALSATYWIILFWWHARNLFSTFNPFHFLASGMSFIYSRADNCH